MPFALAVVKGDAELSGCTLLSKVEISSLEGRISHSDWREELITSLRNRLPHVAFDDIPQSLGGRLQGDALVMPCLGREFTITRSGEITTTGHITPWTRILLLHYLITGGRADLSGRWIAYGELKSGMVKASSFVRECEDPLKDLLDASREATIAALERMGAVRSGDFPTPDAWIMYLLPKMPVAILYWPEEEEFPSTVKILFDQTADRFLDVESIMFLLGGLVKNLEMER